MGSLRREHWSAKFGRLTSDAKLETYCSAVVSVFATRRYMRVSEVNWRIVDNGSLKNSLAC